MKRTKTKRPLFAGLLEGSKAWFVTLDGHNPQYFVSFASVLRWLDANHSQLSDITWSGTNV